MVAGCAARILLALALTVLAGCATSQPATTARPAGTPTAFAQTPPEYQAAIAEAERIGLDIYRRDRAAWRTTDILTKLPGAQAKDGAGWLTTDLDNDVHRVVYLQSRGDGLHAWGEADYHAPSDSIANAHLISPPRALSTQEIAQARAIRTANAADWLRCAERYNVVVRPADAQEAAIHVYLIPARMKADSFPLSGFHDFTVSADGSTVTAHFSQTKTCIGQSGSPKGDKPAALMATHLTSPTPTAFHVLMSLDYGLPVFAATVENRRLWKIEEGRVHLMEKTSQP